MGGMGLEGIRFTLHLGLVYNRRGNYLRKGIREMDFVNSVAFGFAGADRHPASFSFPYFGGMHQLNSLRFDLPDKAVPTTRLPFHPPTRFCYRWL